MDDSVKDLSRRKEILSELIGNRIDRIERIGGGRNSRVYKLDCGSSKNYTAKFYFHNKIDGRDRLNTEYSSLTFLWNHGVRCVPEPAGCYPGKNCAIYEFIDGGKILSEKIAAPDIDFAVHFLARLKQLRLKDDAGVLPAASEACFSPQDLVDNIKGRFRKLISLPADEVIYKELKSFLTCDFAVCFENILRWRKKKLKTIELPFDKNLSLAERTLSPSDFGFHNALRRNDGKIVFIDFEYFGWDDPAKMISDFILHPGMRLAEKFKKRFAKKMFAEFDGYKFLADRVAIDYPLYGLKWCMILLNEFIPELMMRRTFASLKKSDKTGLQAMQLAKARNMARKIENEYENFPYSR